VGGLVTLITAEPLIFPSSHFSIVRHFRLA
jgi:hypothetical protein